MKQKMKVAVMTFLLVFYSIIFPLDITYSYAVEKETPYEKALDVVDKMDHPENVKIGNEYRIVNEEGDEVGKALGYFVGDTPYGYAIYDLEKDKIKEFVFEKDVKNIYNELIENSDQKDQTNDCDILNGIVEDEENPFTYYISDTQGNVVDNYGKYKKNKIKNTKKLRKILGKRSKSNGKSVEEEYGLLSECHLPYYYAGRYPKTFMGNYSKNILISQQEVENNSSKGYACTIVAAIESLHMMNKLHTNKWVVYDELWNKCKTSANGVTNQALFTDGMNKYFKEHYPSQYNAEYDYKPTFATIMWCVDRDRKTVLHLNPQNAVGHSVALLGYYSYFFEKDKCNNYIMVANGWYSDAERYLDMEFMKKMYSYATTTFSPVFSSK